MQETVYSVGIDVGTTTTQVLFCRMIMENTAGAAAVPRVQIISREVFYKSAVHFTPLLSRETINADALRALVEQEYAQAGMLPEAIGTGAVIITGETARKENADAVLRSLSGLAGEFVAATAGSDLESVLAGRGAGTARLSKDQGTTLANLDIGGGTTNIALFKDGDVLDTSCLDIGGRHVRVNPDTMQVLEVTPQAHGLITALGLGIREGSPTTLSELRQLADKMALLIGEMLYLCPRTPELHPLITNHDFRAPPHLDGITFSGGVAAVMGEPFSASANASWLAYGDMGILLGHSLLSADWYHRARVLPAQETLRATVTGVGVHMVELSGSTIFYSHENMLPLKNVPVLKFSQADEANNWQHLPSRMREKMAWFQTQEKTGQPVGIALRGVNNPSYEAVTTLARQLVLGAQNALSTAPFMVIIMEHDMAKALGNALSAELRHTMPQNIPALFCLDRINLESGDFIDIGKPLANGRVLPVAMKTLLFGQ